MKLLKDLATLGPVGKVFAVLKREFTDEGVLYHLCDDLGHAVGLVHEEHCEEIVQG